MVSKNVSNESIVKKKKTPNKKGIKAPNKKLTSDKKKDELKKRKISFDIIELLDGKVNKYWVILGFLALFFVLSLVFAVTLYEYAIGINNIFIPKYCLLSLIIFIPYLSYLLTKHIFMQNRLHGLIRFIINFIVSIVIVLIMMFFSFYLVINYYGTKTIKATGGSGLMDTAKPLIYLYPEVEGKVVVELGEPEKISHSYPKYENKWEVVAQTNSNLIYNNRTYYGLYWEGIGAPKISLDEGFVVKGSDTISFLEEKLAILGLNEREANEFIIYWLPKLENNPYNFIHFASMQLQSEYMPLKITPKPDTLIRVLMAYKKLDNPIKVREQVLSPTPIRDGFVAVEWGGTEIDSGIVY